MKVSELINGLVAVLKAEGDLDMYVSTYDAERGGVKSKPIQIAGYGEISESKLKIAWVSTDTPKESLTEQEV